MKGGGVPNSNTAGFAYGVQLPVAHELGDGFRDPPEPPQGGGWGGVGLGGGGGRHAILASVGRPQAAVTWR